MIRVYTASKLSRAAQWRELHANYPHVYFHARWLKHNLIKTPDLPEFAPRFWLEDEQDVCNADALLLWAEGDEHLRGALVEAGMAIAFGIPVIVIGQHPDYGTWQHHPGVTIAGDLHAAMKLLFEMDHKNGMSQLTQE
jgi:hypothetical protein